MGKRTGRIQITSLCQLDALVGEFVTGDVPEIVWQDSYGLFNFASRDEAEDAIQHSYYRLFRPDLDWDTATVEEVRRFPHYSTELMSAWEVLERLGAESRQPEIRRQGDFWRAAFAGAEAFAATPALAICLAALRTRGIEPVLREPLANEEPTSHIDSDRKSETVEFL